MAIGRDLSDSKELIVETMRPLVPAYVEMFGGMPSRSRYLVVINRANRSDGGAFPDSYSMLIKGDVTRASRVVWGHGIAHELLHFWNGHTLRPASPSDEEWFKEGFTDYLTVVALSRAGLDTPESTLRKLENTARRYTVARRLMGNGESMRAAGASKHKNRFLVYGGGALVAFALDVRIRTATQNMRGLDDLMGALYEEFGQEGSSYGFEDIVRLASELSGEDQSEFLLEFVAEANFLDATPYFNAAGYAMTTVMDEFYLSANPSATELEVQIGRAILGR
jgi:predicted metalloprotease with PDZ domain